MLHRATPERLSAFSDGVFAVLITVLVLELRPPEIPTFKALLELWPTWLSYAVSYLFIAIVWVNHHYLMRYATEANSRLLWFNFAHLFSMSLLPLATAWMAISKLAPEPVAFYAAVFFLGSLRAFPLSETGRTLAQGRDDGAVTKLYRASSVGRSCAGYRERTKRQAQSSEFTSTQCDHGFYTSL